MNLQDGILKALGRVVVNFASMEGEFEFLIGLLIPTRDVEVSVMVTTELSFKGRAMLFSSLMKHHFAPGPLLTDAETMVSKALQLEEKRNTLMHSYWRVDDSGAVIRNKRVAKFKGLRRTSQNITEAEINQDADAMKAMALELSNFGQRLVQSGEPGVGTEVARPAIP